jgi:hypothetical protein
MRNTRTPQDRDLDTRESQSRTQSFRPPALLPEPTPQPGYAFRYVRISTLGEADTNNMWQRQAEGWQPVKAEDHPEITCRNPGETNGRIEVGGLVLCKSTVEQADARRAYYEDQASAQLNAVDGQHQYMREQDSRMPLSADVKSTVTRGRGFGTGE